MIESSSIFLVTGAGGFIGAALCNKLLKDGNTVIGIDNLNSYYDPSLKKARLTNISNKLNEYSGTWHFSEFSLEDYKSLNQIFTKYSPDIVINLAAQAGVRYSLKNPLSYVNSNLVGFVNILESCREFNVKHLIYASSSSVYGGNTNLPFVESQSVNHPISLYAATKKSNELMAHTYSHLFNIPSTGLRFFTVYGPWGRPDMAPMIFAKSILQKKPITVYNYGKMKRDFTYIDDIIEGIYLCSKKPALLDSSFNTNDPNPSTSFAAHRIFNIGNSKPIELLEFIKILENELGIKAIKDLQKIPPGDVVATAADTNLLKNWVGFRPKTSIEDGVKKFASWYMNYYR